MCVPKVIKNAKLVAYLVTATIAISLSALALSIRATHQQAELAAKYAVKEEAELRRKRDLVSKQAALKEAELRRNREQVLAEADAWKQKRREDNARLLDRIRQDMAKYQTRNDDGLLDAIAGLAWATYDRYGFDLNDLADIICVTYPKIDGYRGEFPVPADTPLLTAKALADIAACRKFEWLPGAGQMEHVYLARDPAYINHFRLRIDAILAGKPDPGPAIDERAREESYKNWAKEHPGQARKEAEEHRKADAEFREEVRRRVNEGDRDHPRH